MFDRGGATIHSGRLGLLLDRVRRYDWIVPTTMVLSAVVLAFAIEALDKAVEGHLKPVWWLFSGGQTVARQLLSAIAAAMVAVVTMAFSITVTAVTFVAQHYGTHVIRSFMRNLTTQAVMGAFLATFVYALLVLRSVHGAPNDQALPRIAVTLGIVLALTSFGILVYFLYHVSESMDGPNIVAAVGRDLERVIERTTGSAGPEVAETPDEWHAPEGPARPIDATASGYLRKIDEEALVAVGQTYDAIIRLHGRVGGFVQRGDRLATVHGIGGGRVPPASVRKALPIGPKRTLEQDVEFGVDQLVQVAIRGLSPGRNDTFTTMLCLDRLGAALGLLAERRFPSSVRQDGRGHARLVTLPPTFPALVDRAFEQIHSFGGETTIVAVRILRTVKAVALRSHRAEDRAALRRHAVAVHRYSTARLHDRMERDGVECEFQAVMAALDEQRRRGAA